jgi:hypothetical protein
MDELWSRRWYRRSVGFGILRNLISAPEEAKRPSRIRYQPLGAALIRFTSFNQHLKRNGPSL